MTDELSKLRKFHKEQAQLIAEKNSEIIKLNSRYQAALNKVIELKDEQELSKLKSRISSATTLIKNLRVFNPGLVDAWLESINKGKE